MRRVRQDVFPLVELIGGDEKKTQSGEQGSQDLGQGAERKKNGVLNSASKAGTGGDTVDVHGGKQA